MVSTGIFHYVTAFLVLDLVGYIFTKLDTNVLLDFLLSDSHKIGCTMPAIVEDMSFKLFEESYFRSLGLT